MDIRDYLQTMRRFWPAMVACILVALVSAGIYNATTYLDEAKASVAVVSPLISGKANGSAEAQVSFDAIIKSATLDNAVAARMGESPKTVGDNLSVTVDSGSGATSATLITSPLYIVHGKDHGSDRAAQLVTVAVDEATKLYFKINATDGADLKAAIQVQRQGLLDEITSAQSALNTFASQNNAVDLPDRLIAQRARVEQLAQEVYAASAAANGDRSGGGGSYGYDYNRYYSLSAQLNTQQTELNRLEALLPQYQALSFNVSVAQNRLSDFETQNQSLLVNSEIPAQLQVKVLDPARDESQLLTLLLLYGLSAVAGVAIGLAAIYVLAYVYKRPASAEEVAGAVGAPVLVRIPRIAR